MELLRKRFALDLQTFAIITLVLGNLAQAFSDVLVKLIGPGFSPFQYMFLRQLLTLLVLLPFMLRVPRSAWGWVPGSGTCCAVTSACSAAVA